METDQYILWIGTESRLIEKVEFTVRDQMRWATGTMHFSDYGDIEGIQIPFDITVTLGPEDESYIHRMQLESVEFDTVPKTVFFPDPSLPFTADSKDYRPQILSIDLWAISSPNTAFLPAAKARKVVVQRWFLHQATA